MMISYQGELDEESNAFGHGIAKRITQAGEYEFKGTWLDDRPHGILQETFCN